jgi:hypothetical protein
VPKTFENKAAVTSNSKYDTKGRIWQCQHSTNSNLFPEQVWNQSKYHHFPPKIATREVPKGKNKKKIKGMVKRKTFNVTHSSTGES